MKEDKEKKQQNQAGQFIRIPIQVLNSGLIEFMEKKHWNVLAIIDSHKNGKSWDNDTCSWQSFPSLKKIREEGRLNRLTIQSAIKDLIEWGFIKKAQVPRKRGGGYKNVFTIYKNPFLKRPLKQVKEKIQRKKPKRNKFGKFTGWQ